MNFTAGSISLHRNCAVQDEEAEGLLEDASHSIPHHEGTSPTISPSLSPSSIQEEIHQTDRGTSRRRLCTQLRGFILVLAVFTLFMAALETYIIAIITTLEKQFGLSSFYSGMLISTKEVMFALVGSVLSHLAIYTHRPRFLSAMGFIAILGALLSVTPHFFFVHSAQPQSSITFQSNVSESLLSQEFQQQFCALPTSEENSPTVHGEEGQNSSRFGEGGGGVDAEGHEFNRPAYVFLMVAAVFFGISNCTIGPVGLTYIDDGASHKNSSLYMGIIQANKPLGPMIAFLLGGVFMKIHTSLKDPGYDSTSHLWIGAWWLGYLVLPGVVLPAALALCPFPSYPQHEDDKMRYMEKKVDKVAKQESVRSVVKAYGGCIYRLCTNPIFMLVLLSSCLGSFLLSGFFPFLPKYIEEYFHQTASFANLVTGIMATTLGAIGILVGGVLVSKLHLNTSQCIIVYLVATGAGLCLLFVGMFITCHQPSYVDHMGSTSKAPSQTHPSACSPSCNCLSTFSPVCGSDGVIYRSPCYAGCQQVHTTTLGDEVYNYTSCSCISAAHNSTKAASSSSATHTLQPTAVSGLCHVSCPTTMYYVLVVALGALLTFLGIVPSMVVTMRCVPQDDRTVALAFSSSICNLLGFVPGPLIYGSVIDSTCIQWQQSAPAEVTSSTGDGGVTDTISSSSGGGSGACMLYDMDSFRIKYHLITSALKLACVGVLLVTYYVNIRSTTSREAELEAENPFQEVTLFDITEIDATRPSEDQRRGFHRLED